MNANPAVVDTISFRSGPDSVAALSSSLSGTTFAMVSPSPDGKDISHSSRPTSFRLLATKLDHACLHLSPSFFSINMGTGIVSILLHGLPYNAEWLRGIANGIFAVNVIIFVMLLLGTMARLALWKGIGRALRTHKSAGFFWGCLPMGLITIVNMIALVCVPAWGYRWAQLALGLWWIDVTLAIFINFGMVFMMFTRQHHTLDSLSASLLLPVVTSVVAAASGGLVATALMPFDPALARSTVIAAYVVWGTGVPLALMIVTIFIYRTLMGGPPATRTLTSVFLPVGMCGQGSFGIMLLGKTVRSLAYSYGVGFAVLPDGVTSNASFQGLADAVYAGGLVAGLILWGLGTCWYVLAFALVIDHARTKRDFFWLKNFSVGMWALTFPIGVFATSTTLLASELDSIAFRVIGTFLSLQVVLHWIYASVLTLWKVFDGSIFAAIEVMDLGADGPERRFGRGRVTKADSEGHPAGIGAII